MMIFQAQFEDLYLPEWSNALCSDRKQLDMLAVGAYDGDKLVGLAGCSADAEKIVKSGLIPAWAEMTVKPIDTVRSMNI